MYAILKSKSVHLWLFIFWDESHRTWECYNIDCKFLFTGLWLIIHTKGKLVKWLCQHSTISVVNLKGRMLSADLHSRDSINVQCLISLASSWLAAHQLVYMSTFTHTRVMAEKQTRCRHTHSPQYPGVPHTVLIVTSVEVIFDRPKSANFSSDSSDGSAYSRFSGFRSLCTIPFSWRYWKGRTTTNYKMIQLRNSTPLPFFHVLYHLKTPNSVNGKYCQKSPIPLQRSIFI